MYYLNKRVEESKKKRVRFTSHSLKKCNYEIHKYILLYLRVCKDITFFLYHTQKSKKKIKVRKKTYLN